MPEPLVIVGASVRAAACSAIRGGFDPIGVDLFADLDLAAACPAVRVAPEDYPGGLVDAVASLPPGPWMYTGALENHPEVVDRIASSRPLWGNPGAVLRRVRDPIILAETLRSAGLPSLDVRADPTGLPADGSWLVKPLRSAGGTRIRAWDGLTPVDGSSYLQRRAIGPSGSAVFVASAGESKLLGVTRQWVGHDGEPYAYLGSVGPVRVSAGVGRQLDRIGRVLAAAFGLRGLFGVDFILSGGIAWPTEVNPRLSASVEVLELATGRSLLRSHAGVFVFEGDGHTSCGMGRVPRFGRVGKVIVYAPVDGEVPPGWRPRPVDLRSAVFPMLADLPGPGTSFRAGQPVLTLLARGRTAERCRGRLIHRLRSARRRLRGWSREEGG